MLSLKTATPYLLILCVAIGVFGGLKLSEIANNAKTIPPAKTA